ncbi:MarR family transcriptional regulator, partial [Nesterenkonia populi]
MIQGTATSDEPHTAVRDDTAARPAAAPVPGELARLGRRSFSRGLVAETQESGKNDFARPQRRDRPRNGEALRPGARQETLREANLLVLTEEIFAAAEPLSRADLSIRTGMTRSTVSRLVDELLAAGIVREGSPVVGGARGRPAVPLTPARKTLAGLGVEVNVDFMAARALDLTGAVLSEEIIEGDY